MRCYWV